MASISWDRIATGGLIVLIGLVLLLWTTDTIEAETFWAWVPALFVILGLWALVKSGFRNIVGPIMVIAIAGALFLRMIGVLEAGVLGAWWPVFIVLFGVLVVINRSRRHRRIRIEGDAGDLDAIAVFGTTDRRIASDRFGEAEMAAIFGDARLDLRDCAIDRPPALVDVVSIFGDVELIVPAEWTIQFEVMSIFGETIDRRRSSPDRESNEVELIVSGTAIFGDIEIRD